MSASAKVILDKVVISDEDVVCAEGDATEELAWLWIAGPDPKDWGGDVTGAKQHALYLAGAHQNDAGEKEGDEAKGLALISRTAKAPPGANFESIPLNTVLKGGEGGTFRMDVALSFQSNPDSEGTIALTGMDYNVKDWLGRDLMKEQKSSRPSWCVSSSEDICGQVDNPQYFRRFLPGVWRFILDRGRGELFVRVLCADPKEYDDLADKADDAAARDEYEAKITEADDGRDAYLPRSEATSYAHSMTLFGNIDPDLDLTFTFGGFGQCQARILRAQRMSARVKAARAG